MAIIKSTDINNMNTTVANFGSTAKISTKLATANLSTASLNAVTAGSKITNINLENLKNAIKILESNFSNNCCQAQCNATSTTSSCEVCQNYTTVCQEQCAAQCSCQKNCYTNNYNCDCM